METNSVDDSDLSTLTSVSSFSCSSPETSICSPAAASMPVVSKSAVTGFLPPCRICGGVASGFHYGANTCEACKAFFRRCTSKDYQIKPCPNGGNCTALVRGRLACVACRLSQCVKAGMTKSASKKGRYTHERRTQYTKEIKGETEPVIKSDLRAPSPTRLSAACSFVFEEKLNEINQLSAELFPEMNSFMNQKEEIRSRMNKLIEEHCPGDIIPTKTIYSPGPGDVQLFKQFSDNLSDAASMNKAASIAITKTLSSEQISGTLSSMEQRDGNNIPSLLEISKNFPTSISQTIKSETFQSLSITSENCENVFPPPEISETVMLSPESCDNRCSGFDTQAVNVLWENWMMVAEMLFVELTKFAKRLTGFDELTINDRIVLLKAARIEVSTLMAHPCCRPDKHLLGMYCEQTGELVLTPIDMFPQGAFTHRFNDEHNKVMARLLKANYTLGDMNVLIAFVILSADREGLVERAKVESLQEDMLQLLEYTLKRNHPQSHGKLAETLLLLPVLREHSEMMRRLLYAGKIESNPQLTPLIDEVL